MTDKIAEAKALAVKPGLDEPDDGAFLAKEFGMHGQPAEQVRDLEVIEGEILFYKRQTGMALIEIGKRLNEAKAQLGHGEWLPWLREKVDISERSAQDFMRLAREYSKSAEIADLGASKALALLALPVSERSEFVQEKHVVNGEEKAVSDMTAAELKRVIRERDEERKRNEELKRGMETQLTEQRRAYEVKLTDAQDKLAEAEQTADALQEELDTLKKKPVEVAVEKVADPEAIKKAVKDATDAQKKKHADEIDKLRRRAEEAEAQKKQMEAAAAEAKKKAEAAGDAEKYRAEAEALRKQLAMADPVTAEFKGLFDQVSRICGRLRTMAGEAPADVQPKLKAALHALGKQLTES